MGLDVSVYAIEQPKMCQHVRLSAPAPQHAPTMQEGKIGLNVSVCVCATEQPKMCQHVRLSAPAPQHAPTVQERI